MLYVGLRCCIGQTILQQASLTAAAPEKQPAAAAGWRQVRVGRRSKVMQLVMVALLVAAAMLHWSICLAAAFDIACQARNLSMLTAVVLITFSICCRSPPELMAATSDGINYTDVGKVTAEMQQQPLLPALLLLLLLQPATTGGCHLRWHGQRVQLQCRQQQQQRLGSQ
jgi:hypothetical protein